MDIERAEEQAEPASPAAPGLPGKDFPVINRVALLLAGAAVFLAGVAVSGLFSAPPLHEADSLAAVQTELGALRQDVERIAAQLAQMQGDFEIVRDAALGIVRASEDDDPALGAADAPVVIIEFSDFQCPYCRKFHQETLPALIEEYVDAGKVRFVFRDFPLTQIHANAVDSALAAECADDQGRFWAMHDLLFERQAEWSASTDLHGFLSQYAERLGLDADLFNDCVGARLHYQEIAGDLQSGVDYGVTGTPYFFVNGLPLNGALPIGAFRQAIDAELERLAK